MRNLSFAPLFALVLASSSLVACSKKSASEDKSSETKDEKKKKDGDKSSSDDEASKKKKDKPKAQEKSAGDEQGDDGDKAKAGSGCKFPDGDLKADFTVTKACKVKIDRGIIVREGAVLTIEPGARLSFGPDGYLEVVYGRLVAKGSDDAPIVFTSSNKDPAAGDWPGLFFDDKTMNDTVLDKVTVEYAGRDAHGSHGAVTLEGEVRGGRVAITSSKLRESGSNGVRVENDASSFAKFEGNSFEKLGDASLSAPSMVLGSVGKNDWGGFVIRTGGDVTATITWPAADVPFVLQRALVVRGKKDAAVLTLADKSVLKFGPDAYIEVGLENGSGLVAKGCTFTSANATAAPGDWPGIFFADKTTGSVIDGGTIEYAGRDAHGAHAAITYEGSAKKIVNAKVTGVTFKKNLSAAFSSDDGDCGAADDDASANKADGPLCKKKK